MYIDAKRQKTQARSKASPAKETGRLDPRPLTAVPNSAMESMMGVSDQGGYAIPDLEQRMQTRVGRLHTDMAAEQEATEVGRQFMHSQDVVGDMSNAFGQDLSLVRIHTDTGANRRAEERGVDAFSTGRDIYFAQGAFDRNDPASRGLLAHELSHSLQQGVGGSDSGMAQSAPMGAEQGGLLSFFKKKSKKSEPALEMGRNQGVTNNEILNEIDAMDSDTLMDYLRSGRDRHLEGDDAVSRKIGGQNTFSTSQRDYALAKMADIASDEQLHSSELQDMILNQFISGVNKRMTDAQASGSSDKTATALAGFRGNDAHLYSFNRMVNRLMSDQARNNMVNAIGEADIDSVTLSGGGMGAGGTISRKNYDNAGGILEKEGAAMMSQSPEVMSLYSRAGEAFKGVKGFESPEEQSKWLMNNFALRSVAPAITASSVKISKDAMEEQDEGKKQALMDKRTKLIHGGKALQTYANTTLTDGDSDYMRLLAGPLAAAQAARPAAPAPAPDFTPGTKTSEETMSYRKHTGKVRLDFDPATASEDESLGVLFDAIKRHEKDPEFDPEELSRLKREFAQRRRRQMDAQ